MYVSATQLCLRNIPKLTMYLRLLHRFSTINLNSFSAISCYMLLLLIPQFSAMSKISSKTQLNYHKDSQYVLVFVPMCLKIIQNYFIDISYCINFKTMFEPFLYLYGIDFCYVSSMMLSVQCTFVFQVIEGCAPCRIS